MLERLAAANVPPTFGHMNEIEPWLAAAQVGKFELPPEALDLVTQGLHLGRLHTENAAPPAYRDKDVEKLLAGATLAEILDADDDHARAEDRHNRGVTLLIGADGLLEGVARDVFLPLRDDLITGPLREALAALLKEARKAADKLKRYAPDFGPALLADGSPSELEVWRDSRRLQADLETFQQAWLVSWYQATSRRAPVGPEFFPQRPGGYFVWTNAEAVTPEALRLGHDVEVLRIAAAPSEYRLLAPSELQPLIAALQADSQPEGPSASYRIRRGVCV
jgi:hypothetical protein